MKGAGILVGNFEVDEIFQTPKSDHFKLRLHESSK